MGLASARALVDGGTNVVITSRDQGRIEQAEASLEAPKRVRAVAADLSDEKAPPTRLVAEARATAFGGLSGAVSAVGGPPAGRFEDTTEDQWRGAFESVFLGGLRMAREVLDEPFDPAEQIAVTMVLSLSVKSPIPSLALSNGLRPGLAVAAKTLAGAYGPRGGRVNVLPPEPIDTDRIRSLDAGTGDADASRTKAEAGTPLGRYGTADEFDRAVAFITSPAASYVSGIALPVDDGGALRALLTPPDEADVTHVFFRAPRRHHRLNCVA